MSHGGAEGVTPSPRARGEGRVRGRPGYTAPMLTLRLFHGRRSPEESLADWGQEGPTLGPFESLHLTYGTVRLDDTYELPLINGLIHHEGVHYADAEISEAAAITLPAQALDTYRKQLAVFGDAVRETAGEEAAEAVHRALAKVVSLSGSHP